MCERARRDRPLPCAIAHDTETSLLRWALIFVLATTTVACETSRPRDRKLLADPDHESSWADQGPKRKKRIDQRSAPKQKVSVADVARKFESGPQCEQSARTLYSSNPGGGWALLRQCIIQKGFAKLRILLDAPWDTIIKSRWEEDTAPLVTYVVARRGANLALDLRMLQQKGLRISSLKQALSDPDAYNKRLLLMKGAIVDAKVKGKSMVLLVATDHGDAEAKLPNVDSRLKTDTDYLFLVRFMGVKGKNPNNPFDEGTAVVEIIRQFRPDVALIF